jgi:hypothetical protein
MRRASVSLTLAIVLTLIMGLGIAWATPAGRTTSDAYWTWGEGPVGSSTLVRTDAGINATYKGTGLPAGQAVTMWFIVINNPEECNSTPCSVADVLFNQQAQGDFLFGAGHVIGPDGRGNFGGSLKVSDVSGSGKAEIGLSAVGLLDPRGAEVHLALHSHGPALTGQTLKDQISSFLGGCLVFLGNQFGIADGPDAVPSSEGECSTIQASVHN